MAEVLSEKNYLGQILYQGFCRKGKSGQGRPFGLVGLNYVGGLQAVGWSLVWYMTLGWQRPPKCMTEEVWFSIGEFASQEPILG